MKVDIEILCRRVILSMRSKIEIQQKTKDELKKYGDKDSTWDQIIVELLNHACVCDKYWDEKVWTLL